MVLGIMRIRSVAAAGPRQGDDRFVQIGRIDVRILQCAIEVKNSLGQSALYPCSSASCAWRLMPCASTDPIRF
jgi:hypothetical protein